MQLSNKHQFTIVTGKVHGPEMKMTILSYLFQYFFMLKNSVIAFIVFGFLMGQEFTITHKFRLFFAKYKHGYILI